MRCQAFSPPVVMEMVVVKVVSQVVCDTVGLGTKAVRLSQTMEKILAGPSPGTMLHNQKEILFIRYSAAVL